MNQVAEWWWPKKEKTSCSLIIQSTISQTSATPPTKSQEKDPMRFYWPKELHGFQQSFFFQASPSAGFFLKAAVGILGGSIFFGSHKATQIIRTKKWLSIITSAKVDRLSFLGNRLSYMRESWWWVLQTPTRFMSLSSQNKDKKMGV